MTMHNGVYCEAMDAYLLDGTRDGTRNLLYLMSLSEES